MRQIVWAALVVVLLPFVAQESAAQESQDPGNVTQERAALVTRIANTEKLSKQVVEAFDSVPRERFLPQFLASMAYEDSSLPLGNGQTLPSPSDLLRAVQALDIQPGDTVLIVGASTAYAAALISRMASRVYDIELVPSDREAARRLFASLGYTNITISAGPSVSGFASSAPFNRIFVHGATTEVPNSLSQQLTASGRMVVPLRDPSGFQMVLMLSRIGGATTMQAIGKGFYSPVQLSE